MDATFQRWCSFVTERSAEAAANSERFDSRKNGWLRYRSGVLESVMIASQSEDAYVEDTYTFKPDLTVRQVVRRGHYINDPFVSAIFRPDAGMELKMTPESRKTVGSRSQVQETYFLDWPLYSTFSQMPFARLIGTGARISVSEKCEP